MEKRVNQLGAISAIGGIMMAVGILLIPLTLAGHGVYWLRYGIWPSIPFSELLGWMGVSRPSLTWAGLQKIADFVLTSQASVVVACCLVAAGLVLGKLDEKP